MSMHMYVNAVVSDVPATDQKRVQGIGFCPHGGAMTSMHKVYTLTCRALLYKAVYQKSAVWNIDYYIHVSSSR